MRFLKLCEDSKPLFFLGIVLAFIVPGASEFFKPALVPILIIMMTFSIKNVGFSHVEKGNIKTIVKLILINYVFLTGIYLLAAFFFIHDPLYQKAIIILGLMPPAIGIISLSYLLKADTKVGFVAEFLGYVAGIAIVPLITWFIMGDAVNPAHMLNVLFYVIVIPFLASRIIHHIESKTKSLPLSLTKIVINFCYALSFYIIIGLSRDVFLHKLELLIPIAIVLICLKFGVGTLLYVFFKNRIKKKIEVLYVLFGTFKNGGAAAAILLLLFGVESTVPLAVNAILVPLYIVYLEWLVLSAYK
ncbi:MAG: hypothetical protein KKG59_07900 [Nanoarchaeota archaeon]|nr:hypothetical protein [Nanoarchaeota archaeon]